MASAAENCTSFCLERSDCEKVSSKTWELNPKGYLGYKYLCFVTVPTSQVVITNVTPGTDSMVLQWLLPSEPVRCEIENSLITYTYQNCSNTGETVTKTEEVSGSATTATVPGLQPHWDYTFTVTSSTSAGAGQSESEEEIRTTLETGMFACLFVSVQVSVGLDDCVCLFERGGWVGG